MRVPAGPRPERNSGRGIVHHTDIASCTCHRGCASVASANGRFSRPIVLRRHVWRSRSRWITPAALIRVLYALTTRSCLCGERYQSTAATNRSAGTSPTK